VAFFDPPWITPQSPIAGERVALNIRLGICDAVFERVGYPQITQDGKFVRVVLFGAHYEEGSELCVFGVGTVSYDLGAYRPGDYVVQIDLDYDHFPFGPDTMTMGVVPLTVFGAQPVATPTLSIWGAIALLAMLMLGAAHRLQSTVRSRRASSLR